MKRLYLLYFFSSVQLLSCKGIRKIDQGVGTRQSSSSLPIQTILLHDSLMFVGLTYHGDEHQRSTTEIIFLHCQDFG